MWQDAYLLVTNDKLDKVGCPVFCYARLDEAILITREKRRLIDLYLSILPKIRLQLDATIKSRSSISFGFFLQ